MKKVIEKTRGPHILGGQYKSPEPITCVFDESIMVKMECEVTILWGVHKSQSRQ